MAAGDIPLKHLDKRVTERYLNKGTVSREAFETLKKNLPDLEGKYDNIADLVYPGDGGSAAESADENAPSPAE